MKNSAETNAGSAESEPAIAKPERSGFKLFSIDEHRLSLGLLALVLISATGYGIWMAMSPFLPQSAASATTNATRKEIAASHFESEQWNDAVEIYQQMLEDDPDNGFAIQQLALARENQVIQMWLQLKDVGSTTGNRNAVDKILKEESEFFESAVEHWHELLDNSRYNSNAYLRLASLHSRRSKYAGNPEEVEKAIAILDKMFQNGHWTSNGIGTMSEFRPLKNHPEFKRLVQDERKIKPFELDSLFFRRGIRGR